MKFEVTVCRLGSVMVDDPDITTAEQAMEEVNKHAKLDEVMWCDDWPATDAHVIKDRDCPRRGPGMC